MIRRPPRSTLDRSSAASDVYKRQAKSRADFRRPLGALTRTPLHLDRESISATQLAARRAQLGDKGVVFVTMDRDAAGRGFRADFAAVSYTHLTLPTSDLV